MTALTAERLGGWRSLVLVVSVVGSGDAHSDADLDWVMSTKWLVSCRAGQLTGGGRHVEPVTSVQYCSVMRAT